MILGHVRAASKTSNLTTPHAGILRRTAVVPPVRGLLCQPRLDLGHCNPSGQFYFTGSINLTETLGFVLYTRLKGVMENLENAY